MAIRNFTSQLDEEDSAGRCIDNDAPTELRQEFLDLAFYILAPDSERDEAKLYRIITQSLGITGAGQPYGGFRYAAGRAINTVEWPRVYDLMCRLWPEVPFESLDEYRTGVNRILAGYRVVWNLERGQLHRVLPPIAQGQVEMVFQELSQPRFAAALMSFREGINACDDRPQRGRDACKNIFDALESLSKEVFAMPTATLGTFSRRRASSSQWRATQSRYCKNFTIWLTRIFGMA
jgi:hypothetical protein